MQLQDQQKILASREQVFAALNDVDILRQSIPGCTALEKISETEMTATVTLKMGPVKANFAGKVTLSDIIFPEGYTITGEGTGGPAGFAKGGAQIKLEEEADGTTLLSYDVSVDIGGKIAQLGSRLMASTAKRLAGQFFQKFGELVEQAGAQDRTEPVAPVSQERPVAATSPAPEPAPTSAPAPMAKPWSNRLAWILLGLGIATAAWYFSR